MQKGGYILKLEYLNGDKEQGVDYDWKLIKKEYRKLKIPKKYYNPTKADFDRCGYVVAMSDRTHGKTTETMLFGMVMHKLYGTVIHYFRCQSDSIKPYALNQLFPVIVQNGYIEKLTDGKYNGVYYYGHKWYYCVYDEDGRRVETAPTHFCICMHLGESDMRKSGYNCPMGDIIIFDEFIEISGYGFNDFLHLSDLISTVFRHRLKPVVFMLSNTIDLNSPWFDEFCIRDDVESLEHGEARYVESPLGSVLFIELLEVNSSEQVSAFVKRFFGFPNPKLSAITGRGTWATEQYQHIRKRTEREKDEVRVLWNRLYLRQSGKLLKLQLVEDSTGMCVYVFPATKTYDDSWILTHGEIRSDHELFGFGPKNTKLDIIWRLYKANRFYYSTNAQGALVAAYIRMVNEKMRKMQYQ